MGRLKRGQRRKKGRGEKVARREGREGECMKK